MFHLQCNFIPLCFPSFHFSMMIPGNAAGVAKQFLRCVFHQLAPNGIFPQLFQSNIKGNMQYLKAFLTLSVPFVGLQCKKCHSNFRWKFFTNLGHISYGLQWTEFHCCSEPALRGMLETGCVSDASFVSIIKHIGSFLLIHEDLELCITKSCEFLFCLPGSRIRLSSPFCFGIWLSL